MKQITQILPLYYPEDSEHRQWRELNERLDKIEKQLSVTTSLLNEILIKETNE